MPHTPKSQEKSTTQQFPGERCTHWDVVTCDGPVLATAIHDGHRMREELLIRTTLDDDVRRREEDPLTGMFTSVGDTRIRVCTSRFEVDLNRPRELALYMQPDDAWGLDLWRESPSPQQRETSLEIHDRFYAMIGEWIESTLSVWNCAFVIDIHSYNHRRDGPGAPAAEQARNPDIELGITTLDPRRWGNVSRRFTDVLRSHPVAGKLPDVRENARFPTGGNFPEWIYATWGERVCTISPEYKKIFMDEWTGEANIAAVEDLRDGLQAAVDAVRAEFVSCQSH